MKKIIINLLLIFTLCSTTILVTFFLGKKNDISSSSPNETAVNTPTNDIIFDGTLSDISEISLVDDLVYTSPIKKILDSSQSFYVNSLNSKQKELYSQLENSAWIYPSNAINVTGVNMKDLSYNDACNTVRAFYLAHSDLYWLTSSFNLWYTPSTGEYAVISFKSYNNLDNTVIEENARAIANKASAYDSIYESMKSIHDDICTRISYDYDYDYSRLLYDQTAASVLSDMNVYNSATNSSYSKKSVCAGYSRAFSWCCRLANINVICEDVSTPEHMFNYIIDDDGCCNIIDVTWDDSSNWDYDYFLIGFTTLNKIDSTKHHTDLDYNIFPSLSIEDYISIHNIIGEEETTTAPSITEEETMTTEAETTKEFPTSPENPSTSAPTTGSSNIEDSTTEPVNKPTSSVSDDTPLSSEPIYIINNYSFGENGTAYSDTISKQSAVNAHGAICLYLFKTELGAIDDSKYGYCIFSPGNNSTAIDLPSDSKTVYAIISENINTPYVICKYEKATNKIIIKNEISNAHTSSSTGISYTGCASHSNVSIKKLYSSFCLLDKITDIVYRDNYVDVKIPIGTNGFLSIWEMSGYCIGDDEGNSHILVDKNTFSQTIAIVNEYDSSKLLTAWFVKKSGTSLYYYKIY